MPTDTLSPDATQLKHRVRTASRSNTGISLLMRRAWFAEGDPAPGANPQQPPPVGTAPPPGGQTPPAPPVLPSQIDDSTDLSQLPPPVQAYIKSLRTENKSRREALQAAEDAKATAETKRLTEQGEWKTLAEQRATELESLKMQKTRADALEGQIKAMNETRIKQVPEAMRTMIPTDYTPEKLSGWLDANLHLLTKTPAPNLDGGQRGERGKTPPDPTKTLKKTAY